MLEDLKQLILKLGTAAIDRQLADGSMPAGRNGPYGHSETPVRNTGHWLLVWLQAYTWTEDARFENSARSALEYLLREEHRPSGANWLQREQAGKDRCNGVIGAAWTIEALLGGYKHFDDKEALSQAEAVWRMHRFDPDLGLWHRLEVDGSIQKIDKTFNHQLWLAASLARLTGFGVEGAREQLDSFMARMSENFTLHHSGVIRHRIRMKWLDYVFDSGTLPNRIHESYKKVKSGAAKAIDPVQRDVGYHAFNLHAFAIIHRVCPEHQFWASEVFVKALEFAQSQRFIEGLEGNIYGYDYNPVGFEMAFALKSFAGDSTQAQAAWVDRQINHLGGDYGQCTNDPETAQSRIYEALELF